MGLVKAVRSLSIFPWFEKLWILVDALQIFGIFWNLCHAWEVPHIYVGWTRSLVWFNLDYFSTTEWGALMGRSNFLNLSKWGQMEDYLEYSIIFAAAVFIFFALYEFLLFKLSEYGNDLHFKFGMWINAFTLYLAQIVYAPICLAISRIYICENSPALPSFLSADPNVECLDFYHRSVVLICSLAVLPLYIGLPIYVYVKTDQSIVYIIAEDHEKRLIAYEFLYMFDLDDSLLRTQSWNIASFRRSGVWHRFQILLIKAILIFLLTVLRNQLYIQALLCTAVISVFTCFLFITLPYRMYSSNVILLVSFLGLSINFFFGLLNASGLESALTIGSTESLMLILVNSLMASVVMIVIVVNAFNPYFKWLPELALHKINRGSIAIDVNKWINAMHRAKFALLDCFQASDETVDICKLESTAKVLRQCWLQAKAHSSVFELLLGEVLDKVLLMHTRRYPTALRKLSPRWDEEYKLSASKLKSKASVYKLMNRTKRILLYKLMAFRFIQGFRNTSSAEVQTRREIENLRDESDRLLTSLVEDEYQLRVKATCQGLIERWNFFIQAFENIGSDNEFYNAFSDKDLCEWLEYKNNLEVLLHVH